MGQPAEESISRGKGALGSWLQAEHRKAEEKQTDREVQERTLVGETKGSTS